MDFLFRVPDPFRGPTGRDRNRAPTPVWHSLRWRIPLFFGALIVVVLASFLWATNREVERTLVATGAERAEAAAAEIAGTLSRSMRAVIASSEGMAGRPAVRGFLTEPTTGNRAAAREALLPSPTPAVRRYELWDTAGSMLLEIATSRGGSPAGIDTFPPGAPPGEPGASGIRAAGELHYFDIVTEVRADTASGAPLLGYLRRFGQFTASAGSPIQRLLGDDAVLKVGTPGASVWTDFAKVVDVPPGTAAAGEGGEYRADDGVWWVGGGAPIVGTDWVVWVGYPRALILARTRAFMKRMLAIGLLLVGSSMLVIGFLGVRLTRPIEALARASEEIAGGDYTRRVSAGRGDEIGRLSHAFNRMSDRVQEAHAALKESHERTHFALAAARIGVWESRLGTDRVVCSDSMRLVHGTAGDDLPQTRDAFLSMIHPDDRGPMAALLDGDADDDPFDVVYRAEWPDGSIHRVEGKGRVKVDGAGKPVAILGVSIDVTERERLEAQLRHAQKMEAVGHLAGGVAHDFNNLLTAILGHGHLVLGEMSDGDPRGEGVREILTAAESAAGLTRQLLAFSRRQVVQPRVVAVNEAIARTGKLLGPLLGENIEFATDLDPDVDAVKVDPGQLEQIIVNLTVNARDAMPDGGRLVITTANAADGDVPPPGSEPTWQRHVMISVSDTGTGMDAATQARIFEPFFTTKGPGQGTGLGLSTVFGIVKQNGGHLRVHSEPQRGSTFTVHLPATTEPVAPPPQAYVGSKPAGRESILLVEDYTPVRAIARTVLRRVGYRVMTAASGEEALALLADTGERPDCVVSDVVMPGMTGPELCRRIEMTHPGMRVLFTSGHSGDVLDRHGVPDSAVFLEKPYTPAALATKIEEVLAAR